MADLSAKLMAYDFCMKPLSHPLLNNGLLMKRLGTCYAITLQRVFEEKMKKKEQKHITEFGRGNLGNRAKRER